MPKQTENTKPSHRDYRGQSTAYLCQDGPYGELSNGQLGVIHTKVSKHKIN